MTIGIPVYKRLEYLPSVLKSVEAQDYPDIELIISDNGGNGPKLGEIVDQYYSKPYRLRQNATTVTLPAHFNQLVAAASGKYFVWLCDDDEISSRYLSELVAILESTPRAAVAIARQEITDKAGRVVRSSSADLPDLIPGDEFVRAWCAATYRFECFATYLARTADIRECDGYPDFVTGTHTDNALLLKLCLSRHVAFSRECTFRWRFHDSHGWGISCAELALASREFLDFLERDPRILTAIAEYGERGETARRALVRMTWESYLWRWREIYRQRLSFWQWSKAACAMPFIPAYYAEAVRSVLEEATAPGLRRAKRQFPGLYRLYRALRYGR